MTKRLYASLALALALGFLAGWGGTALAYNYQGLHWPRGTEYTTVCYFLTESTSQMGITSGIASADQTWDTAGAKFRFSYTGMSACPMTTKKDASGVTIKHGANYINAFSDSTVYARGVTAMTICTPYQLATGERMIARCKMNLNHGIEGGQFAFGVYDPNDDCTMLVGRRDVLRSDAQSTVVHEFGHWLELHHTDSAQDVMAGEPDYLRPACNGAKVHIHRVLSSDDKAGIQHIYP